MSNGTMGGRRLSLLAVATVLMRCVVAALFLGIGVVGVIEAVLADLQNRDGVFIGGFITGINLLTFVGVLLALMGFAGAFLIARAKL